MTNLDSALAGWYIPGLPPELKGTTTQKIDLEAAGFLISEKLAKARDAEETSGIQIVISDWLYSLVRSNVKRGRFFELDDVLSTGRADCLGYTKLFSAIGPRFSLPLGIVEVLIDNAGRYVPHHVNLLNLANGANRFVDSWYGSSNVRHRRIGALVDGVPRDIDEEELS